MINQLYKKIQEFEYKSSDEIRQIQRKEFSLLVKYHRQHNKWYKELTKDLDIAPIITKRDLQNAGKDLFSEMVPEIHLPVSSVKTSGSTGEPLEVYATQLTKTFNSCYVLRENAWYNRKYSDKLSAIKANLTEYKLHSDWGIIQNTGPSQAIPLSFDVKKQNELLTEFQPNILLTYPNNLKSLCELWQEHYPLTELRAIRTIGETVSDELRELVKSVTNLPIADAYSSQEIGPIAIQCPESGLYHTMDEHLMVEVINENNQVCKENETGRIIITDLHNYVTPLIRYEIGDYATVGPKCSCGRGLKTFTKILGRNRNMLVHPDGRKNWPLVGFYKFMEITKVRRFQFIQHDLENIELRVATDHAMTEEERNKFIAVGHEFMGPEFTINVVHYLGDLPQNSNGKYEDFISHIR